MLTLLGKRKQHFCDGLSRRSFLSAGFLGLGGLSLADVLRLRAEAKQKEQSVRKTSVIFIELAGGLLTVRNVRSQAECADRISRPVFSHRHARFRCSILRVVASTGSHSRQADDHSLHSSSEKLARAVESSFADGLLQNRTQRRIEQKPCFGSIIAKFRGSNVPALPAYVAVPNVMRNGGASHLGKGFNPFETDPRQAAADSALTLFAKPVELGAVKPNERLMQLRSASIRRCEGSWICNAIGAMDHARLR